MSRAEEIASAKEALRASTMADLGKTGLTWELIDHRNRVKIIGPGRMYIDLWPTTGRWRVRDTSRSGKDFASLLAYVQKLGWV